MIKTIIFDLGGVIIDIDYSQTIDKFRQIRRNIIKDILSLDEVEKINNQYETGEISDAEFRFLLQEYLKISVNDDIFDDAWNALLVGFNDDSVTLVKELQKGYKVCLLSNTNKIHYEYINKMIRSAGIAENLKDLFDITFLSYELGMKKPDRKIFEHVIGILDVKPAEILFIDDLKMNVDIAGEVGIQTIHITDNKEIINVVNQFLEKQ